MLPSSDATKASKNLRRSALARNSLGCWSLNAGFARSNHALTRSSASDSSSEDASGNRTTNPFGEDSTSSFEQIPWNFSASCKSLHVIVSSVDCWASPPLSSQSRRTNRLTISSSSRKHRPSLSSSGSSIGLAMVAVYHRSLLQKSDGLRDLPYLWSKALETAEIRPPESETALAGTVSEPKVDPRDRWVDFCNRLIGLLRRAGCRRAFWLTVLSRSRVSPQSERSSSVSRTICFFPKHGGFLLRG